MHGSSCACIYGYGTNPGDVSPLPLVHTRHWQVYADRPPVLWSSLDAGRVRYAEAARRRPGRFVEIAGAPDLVVEVVSDGSEHKDTERLPRLYAAAGIPEMWLVDARGDELRFDVLVLGDDGYQPVPPGKGSYRRSPCLGSPVRLVRQAGRRSSWRYRLDIG